jgi:hypothetical protein
MVKYVTGTEFMLPYVHQYALKFYTNATTTKPSHIRKCGSVFLCHLFSLNSTDSPADHMLYVMFLGTLTLSFCLSGKKWLGYKVT